MACRELFSDLPSFTRKGAWTPATWTSRVRGKMRKITLSVVLWLTVIGCLAAPACNRRGSGKRVIAVIPKGVAHFFWQSVHAGAEAAGKEFGVEVMWKGPAQETDYSG